MNPSLLKPVLTATLSAHRRPFVLPRLERTAYRAAHRILTTSIGDKRLAGNGAYLTSCVDDIARIIMETFKGVK